MAKSLEAATPVLKELALEPSIKTLFSALTSQVDSYLANPSQQKLDQLVFMLATLDKGFSSFDGKSTGLSMDAFLKGSSNDKPSMLENAGKQQVIAIRPLKKQESFVPAEEAIKKVRAELDKLLQQPEFEHITAGITGIPVLEYEEMATSQQDMEKAALLSLVLTIILLLFAFRGWLNTIAAMTSLTVGICLAFGFATLVVGHLNILSMAFAIMLIGLGIEYGIQVVLRFQEEQNKGLPQLEAIERGLSGNLRSIIMAAATTALAFLTFLLTDFRGIAELGIIAAGGIVACVAATFTVLPAMLVITGKKQSKNNNDKPAAQLDEALARLFQKPALLVTATAILALLGAVAVAKVPFDFNMMNLQAKDLESVQYAYKLMKSKENAGYVGIAIAKDKEEAAAITQKLEALPAVEHVVSLPTMVPDQQDEKLAIINSLRQQLADIEPQEYEDNLSPFELPPVFEAFHHAVEQLVDNLQEQQSPQLTVASNFKTTLDHFFTNLEKERDNNALGMLREIQEDMFAKLPQQLTLLKESLNASKLTEKDLPEELVKRFSVKDGRLLLQIVPKKEVFDKAPLAEFVTQIKSVVPNATGEPVSVYESMLILQKSYGAAFMYAFGGVTIILLTTFRSLKMTLLGIVPLASGLLIMVGSMWFFGLKFNVANIIVMPLLLGVGIDSAIYILARYRHEGETARQVVGSSAGKGVFLNALTILFSFGALMVARHQGVFSIGAVMSLGMTTIVLSFLLFLPSLLMLWDGNKRRDETK
jgi:hopanoid biosynthesis associated RND transporter like protein HpnN